MKTMFRCLFVVLSISFFTVNAQSIDDLDDEFAAADARLDAQFEQQDQQLEQRFQQVKLAVENAYKGLSEKISVNWQTDVEMPAKQSWTTYDENYTSRAKFDFANGVYQVETLVDKDVAKSLLMLKAFAAKIASSSPSELQKADVFEQALQAELQKTKVTQVALFEPVLTASPYINVSTVLANETATLIESLDLSKIQKIPDVVEPAKSIPMAVSSIAGEKMSTLHNESAQPVTPLIQVEPEIKQAVKSDVVAENQIASIDSVTNVAVQSLASNTDISIKIETKQAVKRLVLTIPFINTYQKNLLEGKLDMVKMLAKKYHLDVSLILAVIETESSFNPMAASPVPAFGLMQLVPNTAGLDAYAFLYGQREIVSPQYLFDQNNNLLLGTTYLHILSTRYLRGIKNPQSKLYCMLASYNTGVGNVARTFVKQKNLSLAVAQINTLAPEQTYAQLMAYLPAEETKNYLRKVLARKQQYASFD